MSIMDEWIIGVESFEPIDTSSVMVGNTYRMMVGNEGEPMEMIETIMAASCKQKKWTP